MSIQSAKPQTPVTTNNNQLKKPIKPLNPVHRPLIQTQQLQELTATLGINN